MQEYLLLDAKDKILGRFCSQVAKKALLGEQIVIINAKDAIISGTKRSIHEKYLAKLNISKKSNQLLLLLQQINLKRSKPRLKNFLLKSVG